MINKKKFKQEKNWHNVYVINSFYPKEVFIIFLFLLFSLQSFGQTIVQGIVIDQGNNPLSGVSIVEKGTRNGTSTNDNGEFTLKLTKPNAIIIANYVGMKTIEHVIKESGKQIIVLEPGNTNIDEVLVVGYGKQSRETLTTSVSKLDNKTLESIPFTNPTSALQGSLPGVRVQSTSGQPGAKARVIVRGGTSINNPNGATPLYIVDGIIRSDMDNINPEDIESLQVLKDAASTSIYGARGSNGVVIITTKTGANKPAEITYSYNLTSSSPGKTFDLVGAQDYIHFQRLGTYESGQYNPSIFTQLSSATSAGTGNDLSKNTAYTTQFLNSENQHKLNEGWSSMPDPLDPTKTIIFKSTDFQDVLLQNSFSHNHNVSVSGGNEKATFYSNVGYLTNDGIAINTNYSRVNFNSRGDLKVNDYLKFGAQVMYAKTKNQQVPSVGGATASEFFKRSIATAPTTKYQFEDGTLAPGQLQSIGNPEYILNSFDTRNVRDDLTLSLTSEVKIIENLKFEPQVSYYKSVLDSRLFTKSYLNGPTTPINTRNSNASYYNLEQFQFDGVFSYQKTFGLKHNLDGTAGFAYFGQNINDLNAAGRGAASDLIVTLNSASEAVTVASTETERSLYGFFASVNYNFDQKYLLTVNSRYDGASNLGANNKWGLFPGISVGWNVHKENLWKKFLSEDVLKLKLRGSYGINGNISGLGPYQAQGEYSVGNRYNGNAAIINTILANDDLKWEKSKTFNLGFDANIFNGKLNLIFDAYRKVTDNLLTNMSLPHSSGISTILTNLGSLENKGVELELSSNILSNENFQWQVAFNAGYVKNKILKLPNNGIENNRIGGFYVWDSERNDYAWLGGLQEGGTIGDMYAYKQLGIYSTDAEAANAPLDMLVVPTDKTKHGGDVNWADLDNNNIIDNKDRVNVGNIYPKWTGGFSNTFGYKDLSLFIRLDFTTGHTIYNEPRARLLGQFSGHMGLSTEIFNSWQKEGDKTDIPKFYWADQNVMQNLYRGNSFYYEKGDFLAIREITLSYKIPSALIGRIGLNNLRLNITGNNLHYFTNYKSLNPEEGGTDNGSYPIPRNIIFGAKVMF
ncbi:TonB-dependent receptor [Sphingobacterium daejeonense]|uniref:SusC/RagA family TonB-linked outer membrane protein n=1 Tax=Sphingobacterium daejeonense TaxID=371142 RepID=UPI0021A3C1FC|nr:TonB-dependent receptor [Sphingobacterium daejeonense]MCT1530128.1 TonB-dependent receptor [Sphingobacterium daejeonense]